MFNEVARQQMKDRLSKKTAPVMASICKHLLIDYPGRLEG